MVSEGDVVSRSASFGGLESSWWEAAGKREKTRLLLFGMQILNIQSDGKRRLSKFDGLVFTFKFLI